MATDGNGKHFPKGLDDRMRDKDGEIRQKRGDTQVKSLRKTYGDEFAAGHRPNMRLDTLLNKYNVESLSEYLRKDNKE